MDCLYFILLLLFKVTSRHLYMSNVILNELFVITLSFDKEICAVIMSVLFTNPSREPFNVHLGRPNFKHLGKCFVNILVTIW